jgi:hypothetical protein
VTKSGEGLIGASSKFIGFPFPIYEATIRIYKTIILPLVSAGVKFVSYHKGRT